MTRTDPLLAQCGEALRQASVHVYRQRFGKHEQDRIDADQWLAEWAVLIETLSRITKKETK